MSLLHFLSQILDDICKLFNLYLPLHFFILHSLHLGLVVVGYSAELLLDHSELFVAPLQLHPRLLQRCLSVAKRLRILFVQDFLLMKQVLGGCELVHPGIAQVNKVLLFFGHLLQLLL